MTAIQELLEEILAGYPQARQAPFGRDAPIWRAFGAALEALAYAQPVQDRLSVYPRRFVGNGRWASVASISFGDRRETETAHHPVHVAFLFRADGSGVALCVTQGASGEPMRPDRARADLAANARRLRRGSAAQLRAAGFEHDRRLDLRTTTAAGRRFEQVTIAFKQYERGAVPPDDVIVGDLEAALSIVDGYIASKEQAAAAAPARPTPPTSPAHASRPSGAARTRPAARPTLAEIAAEFRAAVDGSGLLVPDDDGDRVQALIAALATKPFVILTGMSGSGKTQLALRLGEWFGRDGGRARALTVAVRPDWTGPEALFGYEDALRRPVGGRAAWFVPETLKFLLAAGTEPHAPHLLVLDEMNLAHVERYFSDFLSGIESDQPILPNLVQEPAGEGGEWRLRDDAPPLLSLPRNVFVVGTVNVDETTYLFSPKVLDRATTFEIRTATEELSATARMPSRAAGGSPASLRELQAIATDPDWHLDRRSDLVERVAGHLTRLHATLSDSGDEFGHRAFRESLRLAAALEAAGGADERRALDHVVLLKLLPRVHGSRRRVWPLLQLLLAFAHDPDGPLQPSPPDAPPQAAALPLSARKLTRMVTAVEANQFVSFAQ